MPGLYTRICASLIFPLHERLKGHDTVAVRRKLEGTQWWPADRLAALQLDKLRSLLTHARAHVPYYHELLEALAFEPACLASLRDLEKLPLLSKDIIRNNTERLKSDRARRLKRFNTGGSTGEPLIFYIGDERVSHDVAAKWRATRWWGVDIGDPEIVVWGSPIELGAQDRVRAVRDILLRTRLLPAFEMSQARLDAFVEAIRAVKPRMLFGYPSALAHIARHAQAKSRRMDDLGIQVAFVTAERLYDDQKEAIANTFGCRVANGYGGRDTGFIAHECTEGRMHITAEDVILEIVDREGCPVPPGESGEIVVTNLATADFPFVRYRTGDIGVLDDRKCPCGRGLPLLRDIEGRATDFVVAADGTVMHGLALIYVLRDTPGIKAFKIVQESLEQTRVLLVPGPGYTRAARDTIERGLRARLGERVKIVMDEVPLIAPEQSGKFRYVVSHVHTN
jgi:phenylacetate-coenzyme A ligase PaaK-like adenylate-forming protein